MDVVNEDTFMQPVEGAVETDRMRALRRFDILDTARDKTFDLAQGYRRTRPIHSLELKLRRNKRDIHSVR